MYGLIGKIQAKPGQRDTLIEILSSGSSNMPGCHSYVVAKDKSEEDIIWVTEVWDDQASHKASLSLPEVQKAISLGKPLIEQFLQFTETEPV